MSSHNITAKDEGFKKGREKAEKTGDIYDPDNKDNTDDDLEEFDEFDEEQDVNNLQDGGGKSRDDDYDFISELTDTDKEDSNLWNSKDTDTGISQDNEKTISDKEIYQEKIGKLFPPTIKKVLKPQKILN